MDKKTFSVERRNERRPIKPAAWSHQRELSSSIGKKISLYTGTIARSFIEETRIDGTLVAVDQFTIKIVSDKKSELTVFKSAVVAYDIIKED